MRDLLEFLTKSLVDEPDQVQIDEFDDDGVRVFEIQVAEEDIGKVIGKQGRTVNALRTIIRPVARKNDERATVEIAERAESED